MKNKKKFLLGLCSALMATSCAFGMAACDPEPPVDHGEDGMYYYASADGEYWIILKDNTYQLWLNEELILGRYEYDGSSFVMYVGMEENNKDAEKIPASYKDDVLTITYNKGTYRFLEKISYTVSYNTNGGSTIEPATVINGKAAVKPADPTKANSVFLGWYIDAELKTPYAFGTDVVTSDITLYAKWANKVAGQTEYTVDFDLGYEATNPVKKTTIGGKIYGVETPKRDGYTFTGWWVSIYEDGNKLSYAYTDDMVFNANTTLYAGWVSDAKTSKLPAPLVSITSTGAKWNAVAGAGSYEISIIDTATNREIRKDSTGSTTYNVNFAELPAGDYKISVKAKASVAENDSELTVRYYKNKALERVSVFSVVEPSTLCWNAVENATEYYITVICGNDEHNHLNFYNGSSTYFNFSNCDMPKGGIKFVVTAVADGYASSESETFEYARTLSAITNIQVDANTQTVRWNAVNNATNYIVTVTDANGKHVINNGGATTFKLDAYTAGANGIVVSVYPETKGYISPEAKSVTFAKAALATPNGLAIDDTTLTWNAVDGATGYVVKIGNQEFETTENSYDFSAILDMTEDSYTFSVKAISDTKQESTYSAEIKATYYAVASKLTYKNSVVTWTPVIGASYYMVQVNDGYAQRIDGALHSAEITLTKPGINKITVTNDVVEASATIEVFAYTIELDSRAGSAVDPVYVAIGDKINIKTPTRTGYDFVAWYTAPGGPESNAAIYDDKTFNGVGSMMLFAHWTPKPYKITFSGSGEDFATIEDASVKYNSSFKLPVPETTDKSKMFAGWYTGVGGTQTQLTDANGDSVAPFTFITNQTAYAKWADNVLSFTLNDDGESYAVSAGTGIADVARVYIPEEHEGKPVTLVEAQGFAYSYYLKEISIPNTITLIGAGAFNGCSRLENINIYEVEGTHEVFYWSQDGAVIHNDVASGGVKYLEFFPRAKTGSFTVPDGVETIGNKVFQNAKISEVIIPASVTYIASNAFINCKNLTTVKFAFEGATESLVTIEENAFSGCTAVKEFYLPAQASEISLNIFKNLSALEYIEVEEGNVTYSSVDGMLCDADTSNKTLLFCPRAKGGIVEIPTGVYNVGEGAFQNNSGILQVIIPSFVTDIGNNAFNGCENIVTVTFEGTRYMPLTIGDSAFASCKKLKDVEFESNNTGALDLGLVTIGDYAFAKNTRTKTLTIGDGVNIAYVGAYAFADNTRLATIDISDKAAITEIGAYAFSNITAIRKIVIHATTTSIGDYAYSGCAWVTEVSFAPNGQEITFGDYVFNNCSRLSTISLPATVTKFDGSAFAGCNGINTITVDPNNQYLSAENGVLYDKAKTTLMYYPKAKTLNFATDLPATLTTFGAAVFQDNQMITEVTIPATITTIGANAFNNCINLKKVTFLTAGNEISIGAYAFANCGKLDSITLPTKTTTIGDGAFSHTPITAITIPANVTSIGAYAFEYTYIESVEIPASVGFIGNAAFRNCDNLTTVSFAAGGNTPLTIGTATMGERVTANKNLGTFVNSGKLGAITLPARLETVGGYAFFNCPATITFAEGCNLKTIGDCAFFGATFGTDLPTLTKLEKINKYAFYGAKISSFTVANTVTEIDRYAFANSTLSSITFATGNDEVALNVANYAFAYSKLVSVDFPVRISSIGTTQEETYTVFYGTGLTDARSSYTDYNTNPYTTYTAEDCFELEMRHYLETYQSTTFKTNPTLTSISVPSDNQFYATINGVLYRRDGNGVPTILVYAPRGMTGSYTVPKNVVYVETRAFARTSLTELIFEDYAQTDANYGKPILEIGGLVADASSGQSSRTTIGVSITLKKLHLPAHLTSLCDYAISYNYALEDVKFGGDKSAQVTFGQYSFAYNTSYKVGSVTYTTNIEKLDLPNVALMANSAIHGNYVQEFTFGANSTIQEIPYFGMSSNSKLVKITLPASLKVLGRNALSSCSALETVVWAEGCEVETIEDSAFGNTSLKEFVFPDSVSKISFGIFTGVKTLEKVTISKNMDSLFGMNGSSAQSMFSGNDNLEAIIVPEGNQSMKSVDGVVYNKDMTAIIFYPFAKVPEGDGIFTVPSTVKSIGDFAFMNFSGTGIVLPDNLEYIGHGAFQQAYPASNGFMTEFTVDNTVKFIGNSAFSGQKNLATLTFEDNSILESIGSSAFASTKVKTFDVPDTVTYLGTSCFGTAVETVYMPAGVKTVPYLLFNGAKNLNTVVLPDNMEAINWGMLMRTSIKSITIPASVQTIGYYAFQGCEKLETVIFEEGSRLSFIDYKAFAGCTSLKSIELPDGVTSVGFTTDDYYNSKVAACDIFAGCTSLERVKLPLGLTEIGLNMFKDCTNLKTVEMPRELTAIADNAFQGCSSLESIYIPATVESIGNYAFDGCASLASVEIEEGINLVELGAEGEESAIFRGTTNLKSFVMPNTVEVMGSKVFEGSGIESITLSQKLEVIGDRTFKDCVNLKEFTIPATVLTIGAEAFSGCTSIEEINVPSGVEIIGNDAFEGAEKLAKITLPDTIAQVNGNPFRNCFNLTQIVNNSPNLKFIDGVLYDADGFTLIYAPVTTTGDIVMLDTVREVAPGAFAGSKITSIVVSDYVEAIPARTFMNCTELKSAVISGNVKTIGDSAFEGCSKLESLFIPKSIVEIGEAAFKGCSSLASVEFEERNTTFTLGASVFENCSSITAVELPAFISKLPDYAFAGTGIVDLVIPESVTDLTGDGVFANCVSLKTVTWHDGLKGALGYRLFMNCSSLQSITIPAGINSLGRYDKNTRAYLGETFKDCANLESVQFLGDDDYSCTIMGYTFDGCMKLTSLVMPGSEWWYDTNAFSGAGFTSLTLPSTYETGYNLFEDCPNLETITFEELGCVYDLFEGCTATTIYINNVYDVWCGDWDLFANLDASTTVYMNCDDFDWATNEDEGMISLEGALVYLNGQTYEEWLASQS